MKLIIWLLAIYFISKFLRGLQSSPPRQSPRTGQAQKDTGAVTALKSCAACGTFFQESQGVKVYDNIFCSTECAKKGIK